MDAALSRVRISRLAILSVIVGAAGLMSPYAFIYAMTWLSKTTVPGPEFVATVLPLLPPLAAVACGHAALMATRHDALRGRRAAWLGLALGYAGLVLTGTFQAALWFIIWVGPIGY
jgi:uncharacterized membrane protein